MKYTKEQRIKIGRQIYEGELTRYDAAEKYSISYHTARDYMRLYRDTNRLPAKKATKGISITQIRITEPACMEKLKTMTKEELIQEIVRARITEARLKKGYEVKGDGSVILYDKKNIK